MCELKEKRDHKLLVNKHLFNFWFHQIWDMMTKFYFRTKKSFILFNTQKKGWGEGVKFNVTSASAFNRVQLPIQKKMWIFFLLKHQILTFNYQKFHLVS